MPAARIPDRAPHLRRRSRTPVWVRLSWRAVLAFTLIGIALAVHWFDREGLRDNIDGVISFIDVLYFTMITVTTVGYGDIVPVTDRARLFDTFVLTPIRLFVWLIFLGSAYDFVLRRTGERWRMSVIQERLKGHVVVVGYGNSGEEAVGELIRRGFDPGGIVVIDLDDAALAGAEACGVNVVNGDATRNVVFEAVRADAADAIIVAAGRDDTSILVVLTIRRVAPGVPISVIVKSQDNEAIARQAGADTVINPTSFAGLLLAGSVGGRHVAECMADLAATAGDVQLRERRAMAAEVGRPLSAITTGLGLRVHRGGRGFGFWEPGAQALAEGDLIVEVVPNR
jgi:voltage-gated potassium channel